MQRLQEWQAAHVANEHAASGTHRADGLFQYPLQIVRVGKILDYGIENNHVEAVRVDTGKVVRRALQELDLREQRSRLGHHLPDVFQRRRREISAQISRTLSGEMK